MLLENVKIVSSAPHMLDIKNPATEKHNHLENVAMRYERITGNTVMATFSFLMRGMKDDPVHLPS